MCSTEFVDGYQPVGALTLGTDGNFYGINFSGTDVGYGTVFKITLDGRLTTLHNFCRDNCADGSEATGQLVEGSDGNFYGTTAAGGVFNSQCPSGCGTVFKITPEGSLTFLTATVPVGATTGFITVTTPSGALTSNVAFHVTGRL